MLMDKVSETLVDISRVTYTKYLEGSIKSDPLVIKLEINLHKSVLDQIHTLMKIRSNGDNST